MMMLLLLLSGEAKFEAIVEIIQNNFYMYNYLSYELFVFQRKHISFLQFLSWVSIFKQHKVLTYCGR